MNEVGTEDRVGLPQRGNTHNDILGSAQRLFKLMPIEPVTVMFLWIIVAVIFGFISSSFWTTGNFVAIGVAGAPLALVSLGQSVVLIAGQFDLSVGGAVGLGGVVFVLLSNSGIPTVLAGVLAVVMVGGGLGIVNGIASEIVGINPLIATLATLSIAEAVADILSNGEAVSAIHSAVGGLGTNSFGVIPTYTWVLVGLFIIGIVYFSMTISGRSLYVIGSNKLAARLAGLNTRRLILSAFLLCSCIAVIGGLIEASFLVSGSPTAGGSSITLLSITAVVLGGGSLSGGQGGLTGTLAGVLLLATVSDGLTITFVPSFYDGLVTGGVLLLAVGASALRLRSIGKR